MDEDSESGHSSRRSHFSDLFPGRSKGSFSPLATSRRRGSEIPSCLSDGSVAQVVVTEARGCCSGRFLQRRARALRRSAGIIVSIIVIVLVIAAFAYHYSSKGSSSPTKSPVQYNAEIPTKDLAPEHQMPEEEPIPVENSAEEGEKSVEAIEPLPPIPRRPVPNILVDSRELADQWKKEKRESLQLYNDKMISMLRHELARGGEHSEFWTADILKKIRSRRELRNKMKINDVDEEESLLEDILGLHFDDNDLDSSPLPQDGLEDKEIDPDVTYSSRVEVNLRNSPEEVFTPESVIEDAVQGVLVDQSNKTSVDGNTTKQVFSDGAGDLVTVTNVTFFNRDEKEDNSNLRAGDRLFDLPDITFENPVITNEIESNEYEEAFKEAKMLRKLLKRAKIRYRRSIPKEYYTGRRYFKEECNGADCNDNVGSPKRIPGLVKNKLDSMLNEIKEIRRKLTKYENNLTNNTKGPFTDYSLTHPTPPPQRPELYVPAPPPFSNPIYYIPNINDNVVVPYGMVRPPFERPLPTVDNVEDNSMENEIESDETGTTKGESTLKLTTSLPAKSTVSEPLPHYSHVENVSEVTKLSPFAEATPSDSSISDSHTNINAATEKDSTFLLSTTPGAEREGKLLFGENTDDKDGSGNNTEITTRMATVLNSGISTEATTEIFPPTVAWKTSSADTDSYGQGLNHETTKAAEASPVTSTGNSEIEAVDNNNQESSTIEVITMEDLTPSIKNFFPEKSITKGVSSHDVEGLPGSDLFETTMTTQIIDASVESRKVQETTTVQEQDSSFPNKIVSGEISSERTFDTIGTHGTTEVTMNKLGGVRTGDQTISAENGWTETEIKDVFNDNNEDYVENEGSTITTSEPTGSREATNRFSHRLFIFTSHDGPTTTETPSIDQTESNLDASLGKEAANGDHYSMETSSRKVTDEDKSSGELRLSSTDRPIETSSIEPVLKKKVTPTEDNDIDEESWESIEKMGSTVSSANILSAERAEGRQSADTSENTELTTTSKFDSGELPPRQVTESTTEVVESTSFGPASIDLLTNNFGSGGQDDDVGEVDENKPNYDEDMNTAGVTASTDSPSKLSEPAEEMLGESDDNEDFIAKAAVENDDGINTTGTPTGASNDRVTETSENPEITNEKLEARKNEDVTNVVPSTDGGSPDVTQTSPNGSGEDHEDTLTMNKMHAKLDEKMFVENEGMNNVTPNPKDNLHGMSLEDARNGRLQTSKKWESKVVTSSDAFVPTGPDSAIGMGETSKTEQMFNYNSPYHSVIIPFQMCFYANQPKHQIEPREKTTELRTIEYRPLSLPPLALPGLQPAGTTSKPLTLPPQTNFYNIIMNNSPAQPAPHNMPIPMASAPGLLTFPTQQHMTRYLNGNQAPLFCSTLHSSYPQQYQQGATPGTAEYGNAKCRNCDDQSFVKHSQREEDLLDEKDTGELSCPEGMARCKDDQLCIPVDHWCDGRVHCNDASDELHCSCRDRIVEGKRCDGYPDCPDAEDEMGCNGCPNTAFSCGTWDEDGACVPLSKRCDGQSDCSNGNDEVDCSILSPYILNASTHVNYMEGFLMRNWRGTWYPVCSESGQQSWASQACYSDGDPETEQADLPNNAKGPFLVHQADGDFVLVHHCKGHVALHVKCPAQRCGTRPRPSTPNITNRFRRLVEYDEAPVDTDEQPISTWWHNLRRQIESEYHVDHVTARLFPLDKGIANRTEEFKKLFENRHIPLSSPGRRRKRGAKRLQRKFNGGNQHRRTRGESGRVVGGQASSPNAWPWAVAIYKDGLFHCGATLLDREWILTAAHCASSFWEHYYEANIGMLRRFSFSPMQMVIPIVQVLVHKEYDSTTMKNDIAVMKLASPVELSRWVQPTCLPITGHSRQGLWGPKPGTRCVAVGWGAVREHGNDPDHLREVEVPILARCKHREDIEGDEICAGLMEGGKDTCQGDSGGPLMCRDGSSAWYVAGVVSHGEGCARPDEAGAYTRVSRYVDWLVSSTSTQTGAGSMPLTTCPGFQCTSYAGRCLPERVKCNGVVDCLGGEDEKDCNDPNRWEKSSQSSEEGDLQVQSKRERPNPPIFNYTTTPLLPSLFKCSGLVQSIPYQRLCDGIQDCEDNSDELNCTCKDRIFPHKVCDGQVHCTDFSDEKECFTCPQGYFNCRKSKQCLILEKKCDGVDNCVHGEDEQHCYALSEDFNLKIEPDGLPAFQSEGFLMENKNGLWSLFCVDDKEKLTNKPASTVCRNLGLNGFLQYNALPLPLGNVKIDITDRSSGYLSETVAAPFHSCTGLSVVCSNQLSTGVTNTWEAMVRVNGSISCTAVLLTENWLLASTTCLPKHQNVENSTLTAELGRHVYPPTFIEINAIRVINGTDVMLLHLDSAVAETHYVRPLQVPGREALEDVSQCVAMGGNITVPVVLTQPCQVGKVCVRRVTRASRRCRSQPWTGIVVCNSPDGWLPVGVYREPAGNCGFQSSVFTGVLPFVKDIQHVIETALTTFINKAECNGFTCAGGLCIPHEQTCDGWSHCPYADDEQSEACLHNSTNTCDRSELRCKDGTCLPRNDWSDGVKQCADGSDEDLKGPCAAYLQLTSPSKLCDGTRNCLDKSDESPTLCNGKGAGFHCAGSNISIPMEYVCDGDQDCVGGDDEKKCVTLHKSHKFSKEFEYRNMSYGLWHSVCDVTPTHEEANALCVSAGAERCTGVNMRQSMPRLVQVDHFAAVVLNNVTRLALRASRPFASIQIGPTKCLIAYLTCI